MKSTIRTAVSAAAAAFAMILPARAAAPAAVAQVEIRGLDAFFGAIDRIAAPYAPAGQAKAMFTGMGTAALGADPSEIADGKGTVRAVVCSSERNDWAVVLEYPAAGGDSAASVGKMAGALPADGLPDGLVLPEGAVALRNGGSLTIAVPRGDRIALVRSDALRNGIGGVDGALALLDAAPAVRAEGVLAAAIDFDALRQAVAGARTGSSGAMLEEFLSRPDFPIRSTALGLGLDGADRFRTGIAVESVPGTPQARIAATVGAPASPLANAILFPDAVAAGATRQALSRFTDRDLRAFFSSPSFMGGLDAEEDEGEQETVLREAFVSAYIAFCRLIGDEHAMALFPAEDGDGAGSSALLAFPEDPQGALDGLPECFRGMVSAVAEAAGLVAAEEEEEDEDGEDGAAELADGLEGIRLEAAGERMVEGIAVRRLVLRFEGDGVVPSRELGEFDAAAVGPALYLGTLPEGRLGEVLAELAAGKTAKGPVAAMPAFAAAYGPAPAGASCGFVRLRPALRAILPRLEALLETLAGDDADEAAELLPEGLSAFAANPDLPEMTLAVVQRWNPDGGRLESVVSMPLADLHAAIAGIAQGAMAVRDAVGEEEDGEMEDDFEVE